MADIRDEKLVTLARRASNGDEDALSELVRELRPDVVRAARLIVGSGSWAAEDAAQEAMVDFSLAIRRLRKPESVRAWALQIAVNRARKVSRWEGAWSRRRLQAVHELTVEEPSDASWADLRMAFTALPRRQREVAVLRLYSGLSEAETADVLGCSLGTVKSSLHEARRRLASSLRGEAPSDVERRVSPHAN